MERVWSDSNPVEARVVIFFERRMSGTKAFVDKNSWTNHRGAVIVGCLGRQDNFKIIGLNNVLMTDYPPSAGQALIQQKLTNFITHINLVKTITKFRMVKTLSLSG
ncbi:MAG: hypothetical protein AB8E87_12440 [Prochlorococcus sp.]